MLGTKNMTETGMYGCHDASMLNIELARILQTEREREIEVELRSRRLLKSVRPGAIADGSDRTGGSDQPATPNPTSDRPARPRSAVSQGQRAASAGTVSR